MKKFAHKIMNKEVAACLTVWKSTQQAEKAGLVARERGEAVYKRVGMRMLNKDLSDRFIIWSSSWRAGQQALLIMKRVGARMMMAEMVEAYGNRRGSASSGVLDMVNDLVLIELATRQPGSIRCFV